MRAASALPPASPGAPQAPAWLFGGSVRSERSARSWARRAPPPPHLGPPGPRPQGAPHSQPPAAPGQLGSRPCGARQPASGQLPKSRGRSASLPNAPAPQLPLAHVPASPRLPPGAARVRHARERRCLGVAASHPRAGFPDSEGLRLPPQRAASPPSSGPPGAWVIQKFSKSKRPRALYQAGNRPRGRFLPALWSWQRSHRVELASKGTLRLARLLSRLPPLYVRCTQLSPRSSKCQALHRFGLSKWRKSRGTRFPAQPLTIFVALPLTGGIKGGCK